MALPETGSLVYGVGKKNDFPSDEQMVRHVVRAKRAIEDLAGRAIDDPEIRREHHIARDELDHLTSVINMFPFYDIGQIFGEADRRLEESRKRTVKPILTT